MIEVIIPVVIGFMIMIGLLVYFFVIPAVQKSKTQEQITAKSAEDAAIKAINAAEQARTATSAAAAQAAANAAVLAADEAQRTAEILEQLVINTVDPTEKAMVQAEATKARAASTMAAAQAQAATNFAATKLEANTAPTAAEREAAEREAAEIAARNQQEQDAREAAKDPTTPAPPITPAAGSVPLPILSEAEITSNTKYCKDNYQKAYEYYNKNVKLFFPELDKPQTYSDKITSSNLFLKQDDVSYNPTNNQCTYNIQPLHYVKLTGNTPEPIFFPKSLKGIDIGTVKDNM